jgi:hypothetical protein
VTMHQIVARQILADDPPQTWQTVQRLAGLGYGWHAIMHMIAGFVAEDVHAAMAEHPSGAERRDSFGRLALPGRDGSEPHPPRLLRRAAITGSPLRGRSN